MEYALFLLLILILALLVVLLKKRPAQPQSPDGQLLMMQRQIEALRTSVQENLQRITENVNQQLGNMTAQLQSQGDAVGSRLDNAARVIGDVRENLGKLGEATREIKELGESVSKLEDLLSAPKLRGILGESMLEDLLKQVLPSDGFEMQYRFRSGNMVDAVVKTSGGKMIPVDSKFPLENFRQMLAREVEADRRPFQKAFINDVKKHIDAISSKYIVPDEGTFDFALMYIPAENVYYETIIKDEATNGSDLYTYALQKHVVPVSPNSLFAHLQVVAFGLKGLQIEKRASEIKANLSRLRIDMVKVSEAFEVLGSHLENARKRYDEADKKFSQFRNRLESVAEIEPTVEPPKLFPEP
jgi:DNA recombination protein RmuC